MNDRRRIVLDYLVEQGKQPSYRYERNSMKILMTLPILLLAGCGLTPKQLQALDGAMCNKAKGAGLEFTTSIVGGASKGTNTQINGENCSITTIGKP